MYLLTPKLEARIEASVPLPSGGLPPGRLTGACAEGGLEWKDSNVNPLPFGRGSKFNRQTTAGCSPLFHLPGFRFGYVLSTHSHF